MGKTRRLSDLRVRKVSLVDRAAVRDTDQPEEPMTFLVAKGEQLRFDGCDECPPVEQWELETAAKAEVELAQGMLGGTKISDLPDSSFADPEGRNYPIRTADGKLDRAHVANARARCAQSQTTCPPDVARALAAAAREMGMEASKQETEPDAEPVITSQEDPKVPEEQQELSPQDAIARLDAVVDRGELAPAASQAIKQAFRALVAYKAEIPPEVLHAASVATGLAMKDSVAKEDLPAPFREFVEQVEKRAADAAAAAAETANVLKAEQDRAQTVEYVAKAATMQRVPVVGADPVKFGSILKSAANAMPAEQFELLMQVFRSTDALIGLGDVLKSVGSERGGRSSAMDDITRKTAELRKAEPKLTDAQAMNRVLQENPELYAAYRNEAGGR